MIIKITNPALENTAKIEQKTTSKLSIIYPENSDVFPKQLKNEINNYVKRNLIILQPKENKFVFKYCPSCLKAHALKTAEKLNLNEKIKKNIEQKFNCKTGHNGYYTDKNEVIKI